MKWYYKFAIAQVFTLLLAIIGFFINSSNLSTFGIILFIIFVFLHILEIIVRHKYLDKFKQSSG